MSEEQNLEELIFNELSTKEKQALIDDLVQEGLVEVGYRDEAGMVTFYSRPDCELVYQLTTRGHQEASIEWESDWHS